MPPSDTPPPPALPTPAELDALEALLGRATPGPLEMSSSGYSLRTTENRIVLEARQGDERMVDDLSWAETLWNDAPRLLAAAREAIRLRAVVAVVNGDGGHGSAQDAIDRHHALVADRDALAAMKARAERAEADQRDFSDLAYACRESGAPCFCGCHVTHVCEPPPGWTPANGAARRVLAQMERARAAEAKVAALEARLTEVAPVVEAAERWLALIDRTPEGFDDSGLENAVRAMLAARAKREGTGNG